jgi:glycosyltransferase involved in cell wall biosynthesis
MALIPRPEPTSLFSEVFYYALHLASRLKNGTARFASKSQCRSIQRASSALPVLNYGRAASPAHSTLPIGGQVKLIPLKQKFPEQFQKFNLLYLVSSALPPDAEVLVDRAKALGIPLVWNQNGVGYPGWCGDFYPWFNRRMARLRSRADFIFDQSRFSRGSADRYLGAVHAASETLFNPVDLDLFTPATTPLDTSVWNILAAGTSHALYRTKSVIDTFKALLNRGRNVHLSIAGEFRWKGAEADVVRELRGIESRVRILPPFTQREAPDIYRSAHVLLHTKYNDPCPTVPIEAMACGVPVVGTRSGGMPELVSNACGVLVDVPASWTKDISGDPEDLANAVEAVMSRHAEMSDAARAHAAIEFDVKKWVDRHEQVFEQLLRA